MNKKLKLKLNYNTILNKNFGNTPTKPRRITPLMVSELKQPNSDSNIVMLDQCIDNCQKKYGISKVTGNISGYTDDFSKLREKQKERFDDMIYRLEDLDEYDDDPWGYDPWDEDQESIVVSKKPTRANRRVPKYLNNPNYILNPASGKWVKKTGKIGRRLSNPMQNRRRRRPRVSKKPTRANRRVSGRKRRSRVPKYLNNPNYILNPASGKWVKKTGKIGRRLSNPMQNRRRF